MSHSPEFLQSIIDSFTEHIVVIDQSGKIIYVNAAWVNFGVANGCTLGEWLGTSYLDVCDASALKGDSAAKATSEGIRKLLAACKGVFSIEYPCHSADEKRWFTMTATPLQWDGDPFFVVCHKNITKRKLAEEKVISLSLTHR